MISDTILAIDLGQYKSNAGRALHRIDPTQVEFSGSGRTRRR
jgi:hypothetical protein